MRYRPPVDDRHMYDKLTVDVLAHAPQKTEIIYKNDPMFVDKYDLVCRQNVSLKEENNLLNLRVQEAQGEIDRLRNVLERLRNSDRTYLEACGKGIVCQNCQGQKKAKIYAEACGTEPVSDAESDGVGYRRPRQHGREESAKTKGHGSLPHRLPHCGAQAGSSPIQRHPLRQGVGWLLAGPQQ